MKKILTVGVFDYFHLGHLRLFKKAKSYADYLIVAVQKEEYILKTKPNAKILYTTDERVEIVKAVRLVDEVILYEDVDRLVSVTDFDIFAVGSDQTHAGFQRALKWCKENGKMIVKLDRTPNISSSSIKSALRLDLQR